MKKTTPSLLKRFITYYKPHKTLFFLDMLCSFCAAGLGLIFPLVTQRIMEVTIPSKNLTELGLLAALLIFIYLCIAGFNFFVNYYGHIMGVRIEADIREDLFKHLQKLSFKYYDNNRTGKIMSKMLNDLFDITELAHHGPEDVFISIVMFLGSSVVLFSIEWRLTLLILLLLPIIAWFAMTKRKKMSTTFTEVRSKIADVNSGLENSISGIRVVQSFTNEDYESEKFHSGNEFFKEAKKKSYHAMATFMSGMGFLTNVANALVIIAGGYFVYTGSIDFTGLVVFLLYINLILQPVQRLTNFTQQFEQGMSGFKRFVEVIDTEIDIKDTKDAVTLTNVKGEIKFDNVTFKYNDDEDVLNNINLKISAGKTVALVGPSGGGKTTLCQLIPRFYDVLDGCVSIDGVDVRNISLTSLRKSIGMVAQDVFLFTGTIRENILYGNTSATDDDVITAAKNANVHDFIMSCPDKYETYIGEKGVRLSGGQKQRISIARAFLKNPPIIVLDEATSALDNQTEQKVQHALNGLAKGRTTVVIAHRLSTIKNADEIIVLTDKGVVEHGNHATLLALNGIYSGLYNAQFIEAKPMNDDTFDESQIID